MGKGTAFKIYLPVAPNTVIESSGHAAEKIKPGNETILLTEDDKSVREMIEIFLEPLGYRVLSAENGSKAIELSSSYEGEIDLLLTDVIMPKMNGQELANILMQSRSGLKVVFMSGYTDDVIAHHGVLDAGINFIQKPITLNKLAKKLREVLEKA